MKNIRFEERQSLKPVIGSGTHINHRALKGQTQARSLRRSVVRGRRELSSISHTRRRVCALGVARMPQSVGDWPAM